MNLKTHIFHVYFFNMDISLIIAPISLKMCMCIAEIYMEGSLSQNFDLGLSFCIMQCRRRHFENQIQKITKCTQKVPTQIAFSNSLFSLVFRCRIREFTT